jgi:hypothetical protein
MDVGRGGVVASKIAVAVLLGPCLEGKSPGADDVRQMPLGQVSNRHTSDTYY